MSLLRYLRCNFYDGVTFKLKNSKFLFSEFEFSAWKTEFSLENFKFRGQIWSIFVVLVLVLVLSVLGLYWYWSRTVLNIFLVLVLVLVLIGKFWYWLILLVWQTHGFTCHFLPCTIFFVLPAFFCYGSFTGWNNYRPLIDRCVYYTVSAYLGNFRKYALTV